VRNAAAEKFQFSQPNQPKLDQQDGDHQDEFKQHTQKAQESRGGYKWCSLTVTLLTCRCEIPSLPQA
jgi:hypothetical protein